MIAFQLKKVKWNYKSQKTISMCLLRVKHINFVLTIITYWSIHESTL